MAIANGIESHTYKENLFERSARIVDEKILLLQLEHNMLFPSVSAWEQAVELVTDGGATDFIVGRQSFGTNGREFAQKIEKSLLLGVARIATESELYLAYVSRERIGDALLGALEVSALLHQSEPLGRPYEISSIITSNRPYQDIPVEHRTAAAEHPVSIWRSVIDAIDRKAAREQSHEDIYIGRWVKTADLKRFITAHVIQSLCEDWNRTGDSQERSGHPLRIWVSTLSGIELENFYEGMRTFLQSRSAQPDTLFEQQFAPTSPHIHPWSYARECLDIATDQNNRDGLRNLGSMLVTKTLESVVVYHGLGAATPERIDAAFMTEGFTISAFQEAIMGYREQVLRRLSEVNEWKSVPESEAIVLLYLMRTLDMNRADDRSAFHVVTSMGRWHPSSRVRIMAFRALLEGIPRMDARFSGPYLERIQEKLLPKQVSDRTADYWAELMKTQQLDRSVAWLRTALDQSHIHQYGVIAYTEFIKHCATQFKEVWADRQKSQSHVQIAKAAALLSKKRSELEELGVDCSEWDGIIADCRAIRPM